MRMLPFPSARPLAGRKIRSVLLAICLHGPLAAPASSQITWQWLNPLPQGKFLTSVSFQNPSEGWVAGADADAPSSSPATLVDEQRPCVLRGPSEVIVM